MLTDGVEQSTMTDSSDTAIDGVDVLRRGSPAFAFSTSADALQQGTTIGTTGGLFSDLDEPEANTEVLQRLLNEVNQAVTSDSGDEDNEDELLPVGNATATFSVTAAVLNDTPLFSAAAAPTSSFDPLVFPSGTPLLSVTPAIGHHPHHPPGSTSPASTAHLPPPASAMVEGGFVVEATAAYYPSTTPLQGGPPPPPPPPPPVYSTTTSIGGQTPYSYAAVPHSASKPPPPSFEEAIASNTPLSLPCRPSPAELSPMAAHYVPPPPAALQDTILLRNINGVFLLRPTSKPTPPYTPPTTGGPTTVSPPVSPVPRYSLPPAASALPTSSFLGASVAQASNTRPAGAEPPQYSAVAAGGAVGGSPLISGSLYTQSITSIRGTPSYGAAPPPYAA